MFYQKSFLQKKYNYNFKKRINLNTQISIKKFFDDSNIIYPDDLNFMLFIKTLEKAFDEKKIDELSQSIKKNGFFASHILINLRYLSKLKQFLFKKKVTKQFSINSKYKNSLRLNFTNAKYTYSLY